MSVMLERWNDDKMDALDAKVDRLAIELREQRGEMKAGFERVDDRFERLYHVLIGAAAIAIAAVIGGAAAIVVALIGTPHL
jgi:hypothetical protein